MKWGYLARYCWNSILGKTDRIFSFLSIFSIIVTITIFISLTGLLYSFKQYTTQVLDNLPLNIEVFKTQNMLQSNISSQEKDILAVTGVEKMSKRVATRVPFYNAQGNFVPKKNLPQGTTTNPQIEDLELIDINDTIVSLQNKEELQSRFDEAGIIVSWRFLQRLGYFKQKASPRDKTTWQGATIPKHLFIQVVDNEARPPIPLKLPVPVRGVIENLPRAAYILTEDFYNLTTKWRNDFQYLITDFENKPLVAPQKNIRIAYYVLDEDQLMAAEDSIEDIEEQVDLYEIEVYIESWQVEDRLEERLVFGSYNGDFLNKKSLDKIDADIRAYEGLKEVVPLKFVEEMPDVKTWDSFDKFEFSSEHMQATVYLQNRKYIRDVLSRLRTMGLFASSPLEKALKTFENQEQFYLAATIAIFSLIVLLSGIVLFSTFYTSVQRKQKQIGLLKAIGASNTLVTLLFMIESALITLISAPFGVALGRYTGMQAGTWINSIAKFEGTGIEFGLPETYIATIVGAVFICSWLAIFTPIRMAAKIEPAQAVRS
ncbi:ABC transporter permease [Candidatus Uabimicrobium amorphum]|uniref:Permease n=1 Tax=Uabimicrobium amorphum TaxID=2596890 RepID=A0A5S9F5W9_UABAM|nr:FtsX-like permease family protein [Candidatus Uabimicrobium amorphum]BBM86761.1 permease [Candidatus Uabimicrobium amorphum]